MFGFGANKNEVMEYLVRSKNIIEIFDGLRHKIRSQEDQKESLRVEKTNWENYKYLKDCVDSGEFPNKVVFYVIRQTIDWNMDSTTKLQDKYE